MVTNGTSEYVWGKGSLGNDDSRLQEPQAANRGCSTVRFL